jgi:hypothetical protein
MELDTRATKTKSGKGWADRLGFVGPYRPGSGPRSDPVADDFPTGPAIGERLPDIVRRDQWGNEVDVHAKRGDRSLVMVFFRSAVW